MGKHCLHIIVINTMQFICMKINFLSAISYFSADKILKPKRDDLEKMYNVLLKVYQQVVTQV